MKWQLFLAFVGPARAVAGLEPTGQPQWNDGVICYTYLSTYLVPIAEPQFPTVPSFPTTRGIVPPYFSNRSTSVPPSAVTEASGINERPTTIIDITTSGLAIPTDDQDPGTTATASGSLFPPASVTSTDASATSSEAASGQAVIFFVSPQTGDERRGIAKRATGGFIGDSNTNVDICTDAGIFRLAGGQLFDLQDPIYYNGEPYKEFRSEGTPPADAVTRQFSDVAGTLVFASRALPNTNAGFCQEEDSGQVYITFTSSPPGCVPISLRVYAVEQCQDGRIIGLDPAESATTEPNQSSTIDETINTVSTKTVTFPEGSSSTAFAGQTSSAGLSQSIETPRSLNPTESSASSTVEEATIVTSDSLREDSSSFPSFSLSSPSTETPLSLTTSVESSITSNSFISLLSSYTTTASSDLFSSVSTVSSELSTSEETLSLEPTSTFTMVSSTESMTTSEVSTPITDESTTATKELTTTTEELTTTTEQLTTTTEEPTTTTTTLCNSVDPLTKVALANPTAVFTDGLYHRNDFASIVLPWGQAGLAGTGENTVFINTNGYITLDAGNTNPQNQNLPTGFLVNRAFLPYWDDLVLDPSQGHTIVYEIFEGRFGVELVVEFILGKADSPGIYHFEANFLRDSSAALRFQYYTTPEKGSSATAGFQNLLTGRYAQISSNQANVLLDGASITLSTDQTNGFVANTFDNTECGKGQDLLS
ncbi:hypothetical protein NW768_012178 [Fusarium equiseti]|uniref:DUF7908 domain-containing protein n=1 Tax=Fusarium equiseti TaxID=61235 RepID=A0ABQ8QV37_FUSEQ|nr:hypothetical protein NW768_012178 [Fusarium equiseti]